MTNSLHFRSFIKFLGRNRLYTAINVFGLSVSLMFVILIAVYTVQELSVDKFHVNRERIYVLGNETTINSAYGLVPYLLSRYPEIEKITAVMTATTFAETANTRYTVRTRFVDSTFYDIFSFRMIDGDASSILRSKTDAIISEEFARKTFGNADPIGQTIKFNEKLSVTVAGVAENIKNSSFSENDIMLNMELVEEHFNQFVSKNNMNAASGVNIFIMTHPGTDLPSKIPDMEEYFKEVFWTYTRGMWKEVSLTPLDDLYFSQMGYNGDGFSSGDYMFVMILISIGILILLFAIINYINLTVAQTGFRAKEMASRRLLGASRGEIFVKFILESILVCAFAFVVGFLLAVAFQNAAGDLLGRRLDVEGSMTWLTGGIYALLVVVMGVVSGIIPAVFISRYKPIDVVKGSFRLRSKMAFSKVFIVFQNVVTISLIASSITMLLQVRQMIEAPLGYKTDNIINIPSGFKTIDQLTTFKNEVKRLASVKDVAFTQGVPLFSWHNNTVVYNGKNVSLNIFYADSVFFKMLGFEVLKYNNLDTDQGFWLNEAARDELELGEDEVVRNIVESEWNIWVLGIVKNFRLGSIMNPQIDPALIHITSFTDNFLPALILVEVQGDPEAAFADVRGVYERLTGIEFNGEFVDNIKRKFFEPQLRIYKIVTIFTFIAILISALGLLAMSTYFIQQRASEIAIRKVFGSTRGEVLRRLIFNYLQLVAIAFLLAVPVIWLAMRRWLSDYSYRIALSPWIFIAAGGFALLIAFMTVLWQSSRAANANPTDSIKN